MNVYVIPSTTSTTSATSTTSTTSIATATFTASTIILTTGMCKLYPFLYSDIFRIQSVYEIDRRFRRGAVFVDIGESLFRAGAVFGDNGVYIYGRGTTIELSHFRF